MAGCKHGFRRMLIFPVLVFRYAQHNIVKVFYSNSSLVYFCYLAIEFVLGIMESDQVINHSSEDSLKLGKFGRRRTLSKVYDRKPIGGEENAVSSADEIVLKKSSLRRISNVDETDGIARKTSTRMTVDKLENTSPLEAPKTNNERLSETKLNNSKSLQSTRTSNSSLTRNTKKREVCKGF